MPGMLAIANVGRAAAFRSGYFAKDVTPVRIGTALRSGLIQGSLRIDLNTGEEPHRCSFDFKGGSGFVPQAGQVVTLGHGTTSNKLFAGRLIKAERVAQRNDDRRPTYRCDATGWLFDIDRSRVVPGFAATNLAPRSLVQGMLAVTSPNVSSLGFTANHIDPTLPLVEQFSVGPSEPISQAIGRMFKSVDAEWYVDHEGDIHAFGAINSLPGVPNTITSTSAHVWGVSHQVTDLSRVFTRVHVFGAMQPTLADVNLDTHAVVPIATASIISNYEGVDADILAGTTEQWMLGDHLHIGSLIYRPEQSFEPTMVASTFLDTLAGATTLVAVSKNISSVRPFESPRWYGIAGQYVYCASVMGVFSATVGSIAYGYHVPSSGPGAITSDIPTLSEITGLYNLIVTSAPVPNRFLAAGTPLRVAVTRVNSAAVDRVSSLTGSTGFGLFAHTIEDARLSVAGAIAVASAALQRGDPSEWSTLTFTTREEHYGIGGPVFVAMTAPAEPLGNSIVGTLTVHDMTIDGFGTLTQTKGPKRTITAGAVRRPTLWQVLQGE
jgi:hypothetical protein